LIWLSFSLSSLSAVGQGLAEGIQRHGLAGKSAALPSLVPLLKTCYALCCRCDTWCDTWWTYCATWWRAGQTKPAVLPPGLLKGWLCRDMQRNQGVVWVRAKCGSAWHWVPCRTSVFQHLALIRPPNLCFSTPLPQQGASNLRVLLELPGGGEMVRQGASAAGTHWWQRAVFQAQPGRPSATKRTLTTKGGG
jgi:hypothetical protein